MNKLFSVFTVGFPFNRFWEVANIDQPTIDPIDRGMKTKLACLGRNYVLSKKLYTIY